MAKLTKQEKDAKAALAKAHKAIDAAVKAAKKASKSARKEAAALERTLEKGLEKSRTVRKPGKSAKTVTERASAKVTAPTKKKETPASGPPRSSTGAVSPAASTTAPEPAVAKPASTASRRRRSTASKPTLAQLRGQAKAAGLSGFSRLNKADLSALLAGK